MRGPIGDAPVARRWERTFRSAPNRQQICVMQHAPSCCPAADGCSVRTRMNCSQAAPARWDIQPGAHRFLGGGTDRATAEQPRRPRAGATSFPTDRSWGRPEL